MKFIAKVAGMGLLGALCFPAQGGVRAKASGFPQNKDKPGAVERAALAKVDFLVGDWEGEGWSLTRSGQRNRFWVKEFYRYRGDQDLIDKVGSIHEGVCAGRTGEIQPGRRRGRSLGHRVRDPQAGQDVAQGHGVPHEACQGIGGWHAL